MGNKLFKNEQSFFGKVEKLFWKLWDKSPIRFVFVGGVNTLVGTVFSILILLLFNMLNWNPKISLGNEVIPSIDIPNLISFVINLPLAYYLQARLSFRVKLSWINFFSYPLSSIPNFILQQLGIWCFGTLLNWNPNLVYVIAAILPLPIMFFIIKFLVTPFKKTKKINNGNKENNSDKDC